jgi:hypothetical protein
MTFLALNMQYAGMGSSEDIPSARTSEGVLTFTVVLLLPILLYACNLAPVDRLLYPASNFVIALYLFSRRSPWYAGHMVLIFCLVSLIRRLVDAQAGWDAQNPILLTPYLCGSLAVIDFFKYWAQRWPRNLGMFLVILIAVGYGTILAMGEGRVLAGLVDLMKWGLGPTFAVYILSQGSGQAKTRAVVENCLLWVGTGMAIYGICQFIQPKSWDTLWAYNVIDSGMDSLGQPAPFEMRAFSTMNSPGSFGAIMCCAIVLALKRRMLIALPATTVMAIGLAIAQYRAVWAATAIGVLLIVIARPGAALRPLNLLAAGIVVLVMCSSALVPEVREAVMRRAETLSNISTDESFANRLSQYERLSSANDLLIGEGLGLNGSARKMDDLPRLVIDGGLIEILRALGVIVGTAYLLALGILVARLFRRNSAVARDVDFDRALVVATFVLLPMGSAQIGEIGFCAWMYIGFGLATLSSTSALVRPGRVPRVSSHSTGVAEVAT